MSGAHRMGVVATVLSATTLLSSCSGGGQRVSPPVENPAGVLFSGDARPGPWRGDGLPTPYQMPDVTLTADNGQPFNLITDTAHPVTLVFFGYTHCPDECPLVMGDLAATYLRLPKQVRDQTQVLFISTDPRRDTDRVLRSYLAGYNPAFVGLRGPMRTTLAAARAMGVAITGIKRLPSGGYDVGHSTQVIGFRGNTAPVIWTPGTPVAAVVADVERLARR
jgi:protein SCO1/2